MKKAEFLKHFDYNRDTGEFTRIGRKNGGGSYDAYGYLILKIKGKQYKAHRMAWLCITGSEPDGNIDHINRDRSDNRSLNLRCIPQSENNKNLTVRVNPETGFKGVVIDRTNGLKKMFAVKILGKTHRFYNAEDANEFRVSALKDKGYGDGHF